MISEDDLPGAYWLAKGLAAQGAVTPVPDWLLAAVAGGLWTHDRYAPFGLSLLQIARDHQPDKTQPQKLLAFAQLSDQLCLRPRLVSSAG